MQNPSQALHFDILPPPQQQLWSELINVPDEFTLYGGTAIALYLGHRESIDFDFFGLAAFDPDTLYNQIPFLENSRVIQKSQNTLTCLVDRGGDVQVSFFGTPKIHPIRSPFVAADNQLKIASLIDLAGMKASVIQKRAEAKDYIDLDAIIQNSDIDLPMALAAGRYIYGQQFNPEITLKALSYYQDGNLQTIPSDTRSRLIMAVKAVDLDRLPMIEKNIVTSDHGLAR
ncbi:MAG: nucleotidyl transferase AbiEii/AbiGii toxin family protein [Methylomonas sp.]|nr:nucleotidyl transferase AbiEii/AbiGii toxin family protein [Methylomonas sp.]